jgi:CRP/FNR family transcriptional activator FtrB
MRHSDLDALSKVPLFAVVPESTLRRVVSGGLVQRLAPGTVLFEEGSVPDFLHVVLEGRVALVGGRADEREAVIEIFAAGEVLIAPAVILDLPYLMSARVTETARVAMLHAGAFRRAMAEDIALSNAMAGTLARHWRILVAQLKELKLRSAAERIGSYLLGQLGDGAGPQTIRLSEDRRTMASRLGMSPESLSRALAQLRGVGVGGRGRTITIADPARLRSMCGNEDG